jgi:phytanoyl-CoA hydroxylase
MQESTMTYRTPLPFHAPTDEGTLDAETIAFYDREGYAVLPRLLTAVELQPARAAMAQKVDEIAEQLFRDGLVTSLYTDIPFEKRLAVLFEQLSDVEFLQYGRSWRDRIPGYFVLMSNPKILNAVESLIGPEIFSNPVYNVRPKVPKVAAGAVPWHQDKSYWPDANANPVITVWIPLVDATLENGCLQVWPRTHKTKVMAFHQETYSGTGYLEVDEAVITQAKRSAVALPVPAGSAILFNDRCVHMSTGNDSDHVRWSVDLRFQPTSQDPMPQYGAGFLARSKAHPERVATLDDWMAEVPEHA